ncbi:alanine--tRNA ligase [Roseivirga sp. BDSF3-8]|uniref:alanine--tRNA ligase n=1 Tax=Roseivirga sp. BDSF3-8 TaxID=3241598 RepID=UPI00353182DC
MEAATIRQKFLDFFESKSHQVVPSAPLVLKDDPTLMFTNAGMNQFKDYFLGNKVATAKRVADTQKCLRVSGKHNDLEEVGMDTYHHTMFEMLGNWSFGDYFKKEAIEWAWELLTEVYGLSKDRLYVTVFEGDASESLAEDSEARGFWQKHIQPERILNGNKKDNFWEMGDTGPCGPCSEIHIDLRPDADRKMTPGDTLVNQDHPLVVEVWNLVFIQYNRLANGSLESLPEKHVDTGMGFERLCMAIQGKESNYETDVFTPLISTIAGMAGKTYGENEETDIAIRVVADHIRAVSFAIADGQMPSNNRAGYVIRRILRRAVRYGYTFLGFSEPFFHKIVEPLATQFAEVFPELAEQKDFVTNVIRQEEANFLRTLENGLKRLDQIREELNTKGETVISGALAFELNDTYGFPLDLTALIARENGLKVDEAGFAQEMKQQKERSKSAAAVEKGDWTVLLGDEENVFVGYDNLESNSRIIKYREVADKKKTLFHIVLDQTPFYAESGGQAGDTGYLDTGSEKIRVIDTKKENDLIVHYTEKLPADPEQELKSVVNAEKRRLTAYNHSATHLLHSALRQVLGDHVQQRGSLVNEKILRFDFSHFEKVSDEQLEEVERIVNRKIRENIPLAEKRNVAIAEAKEMGAMALFGEKYGDFVRVITFDPQYSVELCGGTHVPATGTIGLFKIITETSVAAGVRRIEAITGDTAEDYVRKQEDVLAALKDLLKNPKDVVKAVEQLVDDRNKLGKEIDQLHARQAGAVKQQLMDKQQAIGGANVIITQVTLPNADALKKIGFELKNEVENLVAVLAADIAGKPQIAVVINEELVKEKGLNAGQMVRELAKEIKGGGGGQPFFATAGGKDVAGLSEVVRVAEKMIKDKLGE